MRHPAVMRDSLNGHRSRRQQGKGQVTLAEERFESSCACKSLGGVVFESFFSWTFYLLSWPIREELPLFKKRLEKPVSVWHLNPIAIFHYRHTQEQQVCKIWSERGFDSHSSHFKPMFRM